MITIDMESKDCIQSKLTVTEETAKSIYEQLKQKLKKECACGKCN